MRKFALSTLVILMSLAIPAALSQLSGTAPPALAKTLDKGRDTKLIYLVRHGEDLEESGLADILVPVCIGSCCEEVLNDLGTKRAELLAGWFEKRDILPRLTHVIASHKVRTLQTVEPIAAAAVAEGAQLAADADLHAGDNVQQVPAFVEECTPGFEGSASSREPMTEFLMSLPPGSEAVVAAHSPTIYPILEAFGMDTSDPIDFPRDDRGRVSGFGNLWVVQVDRHGQGRLKKHVVLDFELLRQKGDRDD